MPFQHLSITLALAFVLAPLDGESRVRHTQSVTLFEFGTDESSRWQVLNDGVMGGRSKGYVEIQDGRMLFTGNTVTQGGGFTSVRNRVDMDLSSFDGLELRVRSSGRTFEIELEDDLRFRGRRISRRAAFEASSEWETVRVPFTALRASWFGRRISAPEINVANIEQIGIYIVDGRDGPFELEIDSISAYTNE